METKKCPSILEAEGPDSGGCLCYLCHLEIFCSVEPRTNKWAPGDWGIEPTEKPHTWGYHPDIVYNGISLFMNIINMYIPTEKKTSLGHLNNFEWCIDQSQDISAVFNPPVDWWFLYIVVIRLAYEVILYYYTLYIENYQNLWNKSC